MEKLYNRKIVLISLLKSKGIYNEDLFAKILNSTKRSLNLIHARHVKGLRIKDKNFFRHIINDKYFRSRTLLDDKKEILSIEIDKILNRRYNNNKSNIIFQDLIQYILNVLSKSNNTHLCEDLYNYVKKKYRIIRKVNIINEIREAGKYTLKKLKLISELIDHIDYLNFLKNDITKMQRLRMQQSINVKQYIYKIKRKIKDFAYNDPDLREIYRQLHTHHKSIKTKLLYNQLIKLKEDLHQKLHEIKYGIENKDNDSKVEMYGNIYAKNHLPFSESGKLELTDKQFRNIHINTIYFRKSNVKSIRNLKNGIYNNRRIDSKINIIAEGINKYNKGKYQKSYFIQYQYLPTSKQIQQFKALMYKLKRLLIKDRIYNKDNNFNNYIECSYIYPYLNKSENYKSFKEYFEQLNQIKLNVKFSHVYPYVSKKNKQKNKYLSFTSYNNNVWRDYLLRKHIDRNLANIIYRLDLKRSITSFYNAKNQNKYTKRQLRIFLANLIRKIVVDKELTNLFNQFLNDLIVDYEKRIELFKLYGINSLKNQIVDLQQFYNTNFKYTWSNKAKDLNRILRKLKRQIKKRETYLQMIELQMLNLITYSDNIKPYNILVQSILNQNIEKYLSKSLVRRITVQRSKSECIMMACNNINSLKIKYMDSMPIYVKEIKEEFTKFDEILDNNDNYKVEYIDKEMCIDLIPLYRCCIKFDRFINLDNLYNDILNKRIDDKTTLKDYIYKEKSILNQF